MFVIQSHVVCYMHFSVYSFVQIDNYEVANHMALFCYIGGNLQHNRKITIFMIFVAFSIFLRYIL